MSCIFIAKISGNRFEIWKKDNTIKAKYIKEDIIYSIDFYEESFRFYINGDENKKVEKLLIKEIINFNHEYLKLIDGSYKICSLIIKGVNTENFIIPNDLLKFKEINFETHNIENLQFASKRVENIKIYFTSFGYKQFNNFLENLIEDKTTFNNFVFRISPDLYDNFETYEYECKNNLEKLRIKDFGREWFKYVPEDCSFFEESKVMVSNLISDFELFENI